jgi:hypothetical protein
MGFRRRRFITILPQRTQYSQNPFETKSHKSRYVMAKRPSRCPFVNKWLNRSFAEEKDENEDPFRCHYLASRRRSIGMSMARAHHGDLIVDTWHGNDPVIFRIMTCVRLISTVNDTLTAIKQIEKRSLSS